MIELKMKKQQEELITAICKAIDESPFLYDDFCFRFTCVFLIIIKRYLTKKEQLSLVSFLTESIISEFLIDGGLDYENE